MPKKPNLTNEQVAELARKADELDADIANALDDIRAGRIDVLVEPYDTAKTFSMLGIRTSDMTTWLMTRARMDERAKELEALRMTGAKVG
jgi:hypothetical protein